MDQGVDHEFDDEDLWLHNIVEWWHDMALRNYRNRATTSIALKEGFDVYVSNGERD